MSCGKDDDPPGNSSISTIDVKVEKGTTYDFDKIKAFVYTDDDEISLKVAEVDYKKSSGTFSFQLPSTVDAKYLMPIIEEEQFIEKWMKISDRSVMLGGLSIEAYESGDKMGEIVYGSSSWDMSTNKSGITISMSISAGGVIYCDKDVKITGSTEQEVEVEGYDYKVKAKAKANVGFKKGWNVLYMTVDVSLKTTGDKVTSSSGSISITTSKPNDMKWYYEYDTDFLNIFGTANQPDVNIQLVKDHLKAYSKYSLFPKIK
jgi:hypothetical protein